MTDLMIQRRVVQISVSAGNEDADILYALADDGTIWSRSMRIGGEGEWKEIEPLPSFPVGGTP